MAWEVLPVLWAMGQSVDLFPYSVCNWTFAQLADETLCPRAPVDDPLLGHRS